MKKRINIRFLLFAALSIMLFYPIQAQEIDERWDDENYVYSNFTYGFAWVLPKAFEWERSTGITKNIVFTASGMNSLVKVSVTFRKSKTVKGEIDLWDKYDDYFNVFEKSMNNVENVSGSKIEIQEFKKVLFCGRKAFKTQITQTLSDDRYDKPKKVVSISYNYYYRGFLCLITINANKFIYDKCEDEIKDIFKGYGIINRTSLKQK